MCMPFWLGGAAGGPFWYEGKGVCVCLFGLLVQLVGLFGTEAMARAFLAGWCSRWAFLARRPGCVCLFGRVVHLVGLFGMKEGAFVYAFLAGWCSWWAFLARRQGRVRVPLLPYNLVPINWLWSGFIFPELEHL